jgi:hypothetical protein
MHFFAAVADKITELYYNENIPVKGSPWFKQYVRN